MVNRGTLQIFEEAPPRVPKPQRAGRRAGALRQLHSNPPRRSGHRSLRSRGRTRAERRRRGCASAAGQLPQRPLGGRPAGRDHVPDAAELPGRGPGAHRRRNIPEHAARAAGPLAPAKIHEAEIEMDE